MAEKSAWATPQSCISSSRASDEPHPSEWFVSEGGGWGWEILAVERSDTASSYRHPRTPQGRARRPCVHQALSLGTLPIREACTPTCSALGARRDGRRSNFQGRQSIPAAAEIPARREHQHAAR